MRGDEDPHPLTATLPVGAVGEDGRAALGEKASGVVAYGIVRAPAAERAEHGGVLVVAVVLGVHDDAAADPRRLGVLDDGDDGDGPAGRDVGGDVAELGERLA